MGYARGLNAKGREVGYAVEGICDFPECTTVIYLGIEGLCGGTDGWDHINEPDKDYCGGFFCGTHLEHDVCLNCLRECPDCKGTGHDAEGELCNRCDSFGSLGHELPEPTYTDKELKERTIIGEDEST